MAKAQITLPTAFIDSLDAASALLDAAADEVLNAGAGVVEPAYAPTSPPPSAKEQHHHAPPGNSSAHSARRLCG